MEPKALFELAHEALTLAATLSFPLIAVALLVSLLVSILQTATQVHEPSLAHLPRFVAVAFALSLLAPWMAAQITAFASRMFQG